MVSDTNTYDVLFLSLNYMPVDRLLQKGYCADLSGDEALMDVARSMYPQFGEILMKDGKLYGLPVDASASTYSVNMDAWEALGLTEDDLPKTLLDLMEFTANWAFDYGDDYSEYFLFDWVNQSSFFSMILSEYMTYIQKKEGKIIFNTPEFEELLRAFEDINFKELEKLHDQNESMDMEKVIFQSYTSVLPLSNFQYMDENYRPLYLSVAEGEEPSLSVTTTVMIINPKTTRMEEAKTYMEYYVTHLPKDEGAITFFQGTPEPVESPYYARQKKETEKQIANAKERLEKASEENKASIRDEISSLEEGPEISGTEPLQHQRRADPVLPADHAAHAVCGTAERTLQRQSDSHDRDQHPHQPVHRGRDPPGSTDPGAGRPHPPDAAGGRNLTLR